MVACVPWNNHCSLLLLMASVCVRASQTYLDVQGIKLKISCYLQIHINSFTISED